MSGRGSICAVFGCNNYRQQSNPKSFFRFPRNKEVCRQWVAQCRRADLDEILKQNGPEHLNKKSYIVCSDHFVEKDYRNKNLFSQGIWPDSVPSVFPSINEIYHRRNPKKNEREEKMVLEESEETLTNATDIRHIVKDKKTILWNQVERPSTRSRTADSSDKTSDTSDGDSVEGFSQHQISSSKRKINTRRKRLDESGPKKKRKAMEDSQAESLHSPSTSYSSVCDTENRVKAEPVEATTLTNTAMMMEMSLVNIKEENCDEEVAIITQEDPMIIENPNVFQKNVPIKEEDANVDEFQVVRCNDQNTTFIGDYSNISSDGVSEPMISVKEEKDFCTEDPLQISCSDPFKTEAECETRTDMVQNYIINTETFSAQNSEGTECRVQTRKENTNFKTSLSSQRQNGPKRCSITASHDHNYSKFSNNCV